MKKRFVVLLDTPNQENDEDFHTWLKQHNLLNWHWLSSAWMIIDKDGIFNASEILDAVQLYYGDSPTLVLDFCENDESWAGFGPAGEKRNMFNWIKENWNKY